MIYTVFDIETDGLLDTVSLIHCLSFIRIKDGKIIGRGSLTESDMIREFILEQEALVGHNIIRYDIPVLEMLLNVTIEAQLFDTLGLSWYLQPNRNKHGLEDYGQEYDLPKVAISDWQNLTLEEYVRRCERDVEINFMLFNAQISYLEALYDGFYMRMVNYINFKLSCLREQEKQGIDLDVQLCEATKEKLEAYLFSKVEILSAIMPANLGKILRKRPKIRVDGWLKYLEELGLPPDTMEVRDKPNPNSTSQLKNWLFSLGWQPITFKVSKSTKERVPQVSLPFGQGLCSSVKELYAVAPELVEFEGFFVAQHRLGLINSFLDSKDKNNKVYATAHGFTNTMRFEHSKPIVNLPGVNKPYGEEIRGCLKIPDEGDYIMCGADVSSLEDNTKQHYIYFFDPDYVTQMRVPGFDPHIDIALVGNMITEEDAVFFKEFDKCPNPHEVYSTEDAIRFKKIKNIRGDAKVVNFSATYGAGPPKIAESLRKPLSEAKKLHKTYWDRNKAVKSVANSTKVKIVNNQKWLYNPVSRFWMFLKADKDKFSTLNQSTGVFVFDSWVRKVIHKIAPIRVILQYHDELLLICPVDQRDFINAALKEAIHEVNKEIGLNVEIGISTSWGNNYAECH